MANCVLAERHLRGRVSAVQTLLRPLSKAPQVAARLGREGSVFVVGAYDGNAPLRERVREWRFRSRAPTLYVNYIERWLPNVNAVSTAEYFLDRSYVTVYRKIPGLDEEQLVALHCDPNEHPTADHFRYKAGPHLHIVDSNHPLPHAHLALQHGMVSDLIADLDSIMEAMGLGIELLSEQILPLYAA